MNCMMSYDDDDDDDDDGGPRREGLESPSREGGEISRYGDARDVTSSWRLGRCGCEMGMPRVWESG